ncbi:S8 family serine peptidase [Nonomuraea lactucae]|uniref:S8 family serine peptidase n=1 Tax=Nonomuraea lactucae TaxID=2249762 RepID=UPI000DE4C22E|nr:S8 family serine peptidase [Nonomuraea lactucae]
MRRALISALLLIAASLVAPSGAAAQAAGQTGREQADGDYADGDYIVVLKNSVTDPYGVARRYASDFGARLGFTYRTALKGFSATLSGAAVDALRRDPRVLSVEVDNVAHATGHATAQILPTGVRRTYTDANPGLKVGDGRDERVDADVAVLDTGIDFDHPDLNVARRVLCLNTTTCTDNAGDDDHGHGSNVAGIVAGLDNGIGYVGIAPGARLWSIKVLNSSGSGNFSGIIAGVDWVAAHAGEVEVINMSLGCRNCSQPALETAINNAIAKGVVVVVSAGNDTGDAGANVPAKYPDVITVSALGDYDGKPGGQGSPSWCNSQITNKDDTLAAWSNFGRVIDIAAPGDCIQSAHRNGGYSNYSGTSQAAPHVAGAAAWLAGGSNKPTDKAGVMAIRDTIVNAGNTDWTDDSGDGVMEPLLDLSDTSVFPPGGGGGGSPVARFSSSCDSPTRVCGFDASASTDPDGRITGYSWDFGDGGTGSDVKPSHTYGAYGTYTVKLTVTDDSGKTASTSSSVTLTDPSVNLPPNASFSVFCVLGNCHFDGSASTDPDGTIVQYAWTFGDGGGATGAQVSHTYPNRTATYPVTLTVTDDKGKAAAASGKVTCTSGFFPSCAAS